MPSSVVRKSVPWSRLNPRRKYWFAFPAPLCWVMMRPGTNSSTSPGLRMGRSSTSWRVILPALAASEEPTAFS